MSNLSTQKAEVKKVASANDNKATLTTVAKNENLENSKNEALQDAKTKLSNILGPSTAMQRIKNFDILEKMIEKYKFLTGKQDDLNAFMVSRDGLKEKLVIKGENEKVFEINNTIIIEEILNLCSEKLDSLVNESEESIINFSI